MSTYDRDTLVANLRLMGVGFLAPSDAKTGQLMLPLELIQALVSQADPRLRVALVALLLRQPDLASQVSALVDRLDQPARLDLQTLYTAAVYLQRLWRTRLGFYLGDFEILPDYYSTTLSLPPADERYGKVGLYALAEAWAARSAYPYNRLASLNKTLELLFDQLKQETKAHESTPAG